MSDPVRPRVVLCILDGFGQRQDPHPERGNAILAASARYFQGLFERYPHTTLQASGRAVGLPDGQMGNSEVGHLTIGAGRVMDQELVRIGKSLQTGEFGTREGWREFVRRGVAGEGFPDSTRRLHLLGLVSPGGVHSHMEHLVGIVKQARDDGFEEIFVHALLDGRDTDPRSGLGYVRTTAEKLDALGAGRIATVMGRYYGMDRDKRWERNALAWQAIVEGEGLRAAEPLAAIQACRSSGVRRVSASSAARAAISTTQSGATRSPTGISSTDAPSSEKCSGASTCVPVCSLTVSVSRLNPSFSKLKVWRDEMPGVPK